LFFTVHRLHSLSEFEGSSSDTPISFEEIPIGTHFCWDHRKDDKIMGWCVGLAHGRFEKLSADTYCRVGYSHDFNYLRTEEVLYNLVRINTDRCGGVHHCPDCGKSNYDARWQTQANAPCIDCLRKKQPLPGKEDDKFELVITLTANVSNLKTEIQNRLSDIAQIRELLPLACFPIEQCYICHKTGGKWRVASCWGHGGPLCSDYECKLQDWRNYSSSSPLKSSND